MWGWSGIGRTSRRTLGSCIGLLPGKVGVEQSSYDARMPPIPFPQKGVIDSRCLQPTASRSQDARLLSLELRVGEDALGLEVGKVLELRDGIRCRLGGCRLLGWLLLDVLLLLLISPAILLPARHTVRDRSRRAGD